MNDGVPVWRGVVCNECNVSLGWTFYLAGDPGSRRLDLCDACCAKEATRDAQVAAYVAFVAERN